MSMILTTKQDEGIIIAKKRFEEGKDYTVISGYAGTGKSTLVKFLMAELGIEDDFVAYATFTGKAALVLQQKGHRQATTLHKLLYRSFKRKDGTFAHVPKDMLDFPYKVIVIDEVSMVPNQIWQEALKHNVHIIALGDPFQLPPIGEDNGILAKPHVFLDEVMRQALESDIIKLSMDIREGKPLTLMNGNDVKVISKDQVVDGMYMWADQILVGRNNTRRTINHQMRNLLGLGSEPEVGDKLICLRNYWNIENGLSDSLINGMIGNIANIKMGEDGGVLGRELRIGFTPDFVDDAKLGTFENQLVDYKLLTEGNPTYTKDSYSKKPKVAPLEFDYGYAITVHKSQGSQFNKVLIFEEKMNREMHARWLYTAITRAIDKVVIVKQ